MYQKIKIVIPVYNDIKPFIEFIDNVKKYLFIFNHDIEFIIVDDTKSFFLINDIENIIIKNRLENRIRYMRGNGNYGSSLKKGMLRTGELTKLIIMDIDHPFMLLPDMINMLDVYDVVVGNDVNGNNERKVTKRLLKTVFGIDLPHPTCGFIGFNNDVIGNCIANEKTISFYLALSKKDMIHVEFIYMCIKKKLNIGILDFNTMDSNIKHNYNMKRNFIWLSDFISMFIYDRVLSWYQ